MTIFSMTTKLFNKNLKQIRNSFLYIISDNNNHGESVVVNISCNNNCGESVVVISLSLKFLIDLKKK